MIPKCVEFHEDSEFRHESSRNCDPEQKIKENLKKPPKSGIPFFKKLIYPHPYPQFGGFYGNFPQGGTIFVQRLDTEIAIGFF